MTHTTWYDGAQVSAEDAQKELVSATGKAEALAANLAERASDLASHAAKIEGLSLLLTSGVLTSGVLTSVRRIAKSLEDESLLIKQQLKLHEQRIPAAKAA